jgi:hypothetical protein
MKKLTLLFVLLISLTINAQELKYNGAGLHACVGAGIAQLSFIPYYKGIAPITPTLIMSIGIPSGLGFGKELLDGYGGAEWSWSDFGHTAGSAIIVTGGNLIFIGIRNQIKKRRINKEKKKLMSFEKEFLETFPLI